MPPRKEQLMVVMSPAVLKFPAISFRRIVSPYDSKEKRSYVAVVNIYDMPDLSDWRKINVRDPKETGAVPKAIRETLDNDPEMFLFKNRGLVVTAHGISHNTESGELTITLTDGNIHGLLDGGHTYKVVKRYCDESPGLPESLDSQAFVKIELLVGFSATQIRDIVEARNTSNQVKDESLLNLQGAFDRIKAKLQGETYKDLIAYKEYEIYEGDDGTKSKPIDIREIVSLLTVFDKVQFGDNSHPIVAYSSKAACLSRFENNPESYEKIYTLVPDILRLWDVIYRDLPEWYRSAKANQGQGSRFGGITGVSTLKGTRITPLHFISEESGYSIPSGFRYPILAALRALVEEENGEYVWGKNIDPVEALEDGLGEQLAEALLNYALEIQNPNKLGKSSIVWDQCYGKAQIWYLKKTE